MGTDIYLFGASTEFRWRFAELLRDCGFTTVVEPLGQALSRPGEVCVYEAPSKDDVSRLLEREGQDPFLIFTELQLSHDETVSLKAKGFVGALSLRTSPEDISFLVNKAVFYIRMLKRNPRVPVNIPVELSIGAKLMRTSASMLSRDGIFVITMNPLPVNSLCDLVFRLPAREGEFKTVARVLYNISINKDLGIIADPRDPFKRLVAHPGMAMLFVDLGVLEREMIEEYIESIS